MGRIALVAVIVTIGCIGQSDVSPSVLHVQLDSGAAISGRSFATHVSLASEHCVTLDGSFSGTVAGLSMTVKSLGGYNSMRDACDPPTLEWLGAMGPLDSAVIDVRFGSHAIAMTIDPPSVLETRSASHVLSNDGLIHLKWSHPADLVGGARVTFTPSGEVPAGYSVQATISGDELIYQVPAGLPHVPGVTLISTITESGSAASCLGPAECTYRISHEVVL